MNKNIWLAGIVGVVLGMVIAVVYVPVWGKHLGYERSSGSMMKNELTADNVNAHFIEQMIPHHETAVAMADIALQKAEHPEIKQLAQDIKNGQSEEIDQMKAWYKDWFGEDISWLPAASAHENSGAMNMMGMMGDDTDLARLQTAKPFDKAFIEQMIPHHQMAIMMAQMLEQTTHRAEMRQLAASIIDSQTHQIESMREWYKVWYK